MKRVRDRIRELRRVPASELKPNPKNWRTHPKAQATALRENLAKIGIADAVLARELPDGSLELVDGHLRTETLGDAPVPVLVLDVTEAEADQLLATLDPMAELAEADAGKLDELLASLDVGDKALGRMLDELQREAGGFHQDTPSAEAIETADSTLRERLKTRHAADVVEVVCPECGTEFGIDRDEVAREKPWSEA